MYSHNKSIIKKLLKNLILKVNNPKKIQKKLKGQFPSLKMMTINQIKKKLY